MSPRLASVLAKTSTVPLPLSLSLHSPPKASVSYCPSVPAQSSFKATAWQGGQGRGRQWSFSPFLPRPLLLLSRLQAGWGPAWGRLLRLLSLVAAPLSLPLCAGSSPCGPQGPADLAGDLSPLPPSSLPRSWSIQEGKGGRREEQVPCSLRFSTALIGSVTFPKCLPQGLPPIGLLVTIFSNPGGES